MINKRTFGVTVIIAVFSSIAIYGFAQKTITIKGHVQFNDPQSKMEIYTINGSGKKVISTFDIDKNNNFNQQITVESPGIYYIDCKKWELLKFWAEDENIEINFRGKDTAKIKIKNPLFHLIENTGPNNELMNHINFVSHRSYQLMIGISQAIYRTQFANDSAKQNLSKLLYKITEDNNRAVIKELIKMYYKCNSVISLYPQLQAGTDDELIALIENTHRGYAPYEEIKEERRIAKERAEKVAIGKIAPDFSFPTVDGKTQLGPQNFRGKYLLIDFWASWCGPCRGEIPHLKKYYELFKDKNVEFLSVSIDSKDSDWKKALEQEKMPWPQVLAPNAGKEITKLYQFSGIPHIILLDKEGKIVAKQLRGEAIKKTIEEKL